MVEGGTPSTIQGVMNWTEKAVPDLGYNSSAFLQPELGMNCDAVHQI